MSKFFIEIKNLIENQEKQIADLEAKLAESEEAIKYLKGIKRYDIGEMLTENTKLKQQLAEKDNKIQMLNAMIATLPEHDKELKEIYNQDKISFCIEKLEKVKNEIYGSEIKFEEIEKLPIALNNYEIGYDKGRFKATNIIDNQIEQLKKHK